MFPLNFVQTDVSGVSKDTLINVLKNDVLLCLYYLYSFHKILVEINRGTFSINLNSHESSFISVENQYSKSNSHCHAWNKSKLKAHNTPNKYSNQRNTKKKLLIQMYILISLN